MARKTTTRSLRILRTVLLLGLVGFIALVYALYRFGKAGLPTESDGEEPERPLRREETVMEGQGFDYYITQGETTLARIRAQRIVSEEEDEIILEGISPLEFYREGGNTYRVFAGRGRFELDTQATDLVDNVILEGPRGLELRSESIQVTKSSKRVTSLKEVHFSMAGEFVGRANRMVAFLDRDIFVLSRGVRMRSTSPDREPIELRCKRLTYDRNEHLVRAEGDVVFSRGDDYLRADRLHFYLTEDESALRFISGRWGLTAVMHQDYGQGMLRKSEIEADEFSVLLDPESGDPLEMELLGTTSGVATLRTTNEAAEVRTLTAPVISGRFVDGELSHAEAWEGVRLREHLAFVPDLILRWICGQRATIDFNAEGEIVEALFDDRVELRQGQAVAHGDRIEMSEQPYVIRMTGSPARFENEQGRLSAPEITQEGEEGDVRATGGVRGLFRQEANSSTLSVAGAKGPVRVESVEARWDRQTPSYKFEQNVRLWQGENLLLAEEIETLVESDLVIARGGIRMRLRPSKGEQESEQASAEPGERAGQSEQRPAEVTSEWMEYSVETGLITFHENVVMLQSGRRMSCDRAEAVIEEEGGMKSLFCEGSVEVRDSVGGRTVSGEDALYQVDEDEITFHGSPVVMTGDQGEQIEGATLVYDLRTGAARIEGGSGARTEEPAADQDDGTDFDFNPASPRTHPGI